MPVVLDVPYSIITHSRRVCILYKNALRLMESWCDGNVAKFRLNAAVIRHRFDQNKDIKDMRIAKQLAAEGEEELFSKQHYQPLKFHESPGGCAYNRETHIPDVVLDFWHPVEKAQYPEYFARREQRKAEYIKMWNKKYGEPSADSHH